MDGTSGGRRRRGVRCGGAREFLGDEEGGESERGVESEEDRDKWRRRVGRGDDAIW